jgi:hypothetical protein
MLAYCVQDGQQQDAAEFLDLYLEALDEELVTPRTNISTHKSASAADVEERENETQLAEGQTEARGREYTVCQSFILSLHELTLLMYTWM